MVIESTLSQKLEVSIGYCCNDLTIIFVLVEGYIYVEDFKGFGSKCALNAQSFMSYYGSLEDKNVERTVDNGVQTREVSEGSFKSL